jgi:hypothetical protein
MMGSTSVTRSAGAWEVDAMSVHFGDGGKKTSLRFYTKPVRFGKGLRRQANRVARNTRSRCDDVVAEMGFNESACRATRSSSNCRYCGSKMKAGRSPGVWT